MHLKFSKAVYCCTDELKLLQRKPFACNTSDIHSIPPLNVREV